MGRHIFRQMKCRPSDELARDRSDGGDKFDVNIISLFKPNSQVKSKPQFRMLLLTLRQWNKINGASVAFTSKNHVFGLLRKILAGMTTYQQKGR